MTDPMMWQLQLDQLYAESNVLAQKVAALVCGLSASFNPDEMSELRDAAERWAVIQDEIQHHINTAKGNQP